MPLDVPALPVDAGAFADPNVSVAVDAGMSADASAPALDGGPSALDGGVEAGPATASPSLTVGCLGPESGAVISVLTALTVDGAPEVNVALPGVTLPVDVALSPDGSSSAVVAAGNGFEPTLSNLFWFGPGGNGSVTVGDANVPIAVAFQTNDRLLVQTREPAKLWVVQLASGGASGAVTGSVTLSTTSRADTGHDIFHTQAGGMIACASCHPEGGDDGHVWLLDDARRRTPSLRGTVAGTAPYHWPGDEPNLNALVDDVYTRRMNGASLPAAQMSALTAWVQTIPAPPAPTWVDAAAAQRGHVLFENADVGCAVCHSGPKLTNNTTVDVGTGGAFQVPPLVGVGWRTPLLHDGCAATVADRFGKCATTRHGSISSLAAQDLSDLAAYLETL